MVSNIFDLLQNKTKQNKKPNNQGSCIQQNHPPLRGKNLRDSQENKS
jgi:hypothetical protein